MTIPLEVRSNLMYYALFRHVIMFLRLLRTVLALVFHVHKQQTIYTSIKKNKRGRYICSTSKHQCCQEVAQGPHKLSGELKKMPYSWSVKL